MITKYIIEYSEDEGDSWATLMMLNSDGDLVAAAPGKRVTTAPTDRFTFVDSWELSPLETRDYRVKVENKARHQSTWSNTATATTPESSPPNEPGGLVAEASGPDSIKLCWNAQAEEPEDDPVTQYMIEHAVSEDGPWMELTRVTAETQGEIHTIYTDDMDLTAAAERFYRVTAINVQGPSDQSDVASATTDPADPATAPQNLREDTTQTTMSGYTVMWDAPASDGWCCHHRLHRRACGVRFVLERNAHQRRRVHRRCVLVGRSRLSWHGRGGWRRRHGRRYQPVLQDVRRLGRDREDEGPGGLQPPLPHHH